MLLLALACASPEPGRPSIVLVSFDTTRADRLGAYGHAGGLTPSLDRFATEAVLFERAYSQANTTAASHASLFSSRYASEWAPGVVEAYPLLAEILRAYGYRTGAFVAGGELAPEAGFDRGFDTYRSAIDFGSFWHTVPLATEWLADVEGPSLTLVHGYDAHSRYLKPTPFAWGARGEGVGQIAIQEPRSRVVDGFLHPDTRALELVSLIFLRPRSEPARVRLAELAGDAPPCDDDDLATVRTAYDGAVAYADAGFGMLMATLQAQGRLDDSVVVVFGDHGEQLGEDGAFEHSWGLGDPETHVPLMIRMPGAEGGGRRVSGLVELVDVLPTLLELVGATPPATLRGVSLVPALRGEPFPGRSFAFSQGGYRMRIVAARSAAHRLVYTGVSANASILPELVATAALPGPGFTGDPEPALRDALVTRLRELPTTAGDAPPAAPLRQALKDHGYF